jgi:hypothetical protein
VEVNGRIYWGNSHESGVIAAGASRSWGMDIPSRRAVHRRRQPDPRAVSVRGHPRAQRLARIGRWPPFRDLAERRRGRASHLGHPQRSDHRAVRVYLSTPNGAGLYLADECPMDDLYTELASCAFAVPLNTQWQDKPPAGHALAYANGRIYIAQGEFIFGTTDLGYEYVDLRDFLALDGSRVRLLAGVEGGLLLPPTTPPTSFAARPSRHGDDHRVHQGGVEGSGHLCRWRARHRHQGVGRQALRDVHHRRGRLPRAARTGP